MGASYAGLIVFGAVFVIIIIAFIIIKIKMKF